MSNLGTKYRISRIKKYQFGLYLLIFYILNLLIATIEIGHKHTHQHTNCHLNLSTTENDPCYLKLVHHDLLNGCKHDFHLTTQSKHCGLCDLVLHFDTYVCTSKLVSEKLYHLEESIAFVLSKSARIELFARTRAPPYAI